LAPILTYHVLGTEVLAADLPATGSAITTLGGDIYLSINDNGVYLNGTTQVVATDVDADNGVVHVIDRTLLPPSSNIVEIAVAASTATEGAEFGQLVAALTAIENDASTAALVTVLSSMDGMNNAPFTVFAPTDAAFEALYTAAGVADLDALVAALGTATIEQVLLYHVVPSARVFSTDLPNLTSPDVTMANGGMITLNLGDLTITDSDAALSVGTVDASIVGTDILATNGVIHTIDQVILP
ncbi:MAG: fasciclin domain-containing protein, partial [Bacteroidota bacterium]